VATLTYAYADSTAVLGPLAPYVEPHTYDLCARHSERLTAPRGWDVLRIEDTEADTAPRGDDLLALADAVGEAAHATPPEPDGPDAPESARRGHLRALPTPAPS
jgi:hypothetical protein